MEQHASADRDQMSSQHAGTVVDVAPSRVAPLLDADDSAAASASDDQLSQEAVQGSPVESFASSTSLSFSSPPSPSSSLSSAVLVGDTPPPSSSLATPNSSTFPTPAIDAPLADAPFVSITIDASTSRDTSDPVFVSVCASVAATSAHSHSTSSQAATPARPFVDVSRLGLFGSNFGGGNAQLAGDMSWEDAIARFAGGDEFSTHSYAQPAVPASAASYHPAPQWTPLPSAASRDPYAHLFGSNSLGQKAIAVTRRRDKRRRRHTRGQGRARYNIDRLSSSPYSRNYEPFMNLFPSGRKQWFDFAVKWILRPLAVSTISTLTALATSHLFRTLGARHATPAILPTITSDAPVTATQGTVSPLTL